MRIEKYSFGLLIILGFTILFYYCSSFDLNVILRRDRDRDSNLPIEISSPRIKIENSNHIIVKTSTELSHFLNTLNLQEKEKQDIVATADFQEKGLHSFMTFYLFDSHTFVMKAVVLEIQRLPSGYLELNGREISAQTQVTAKRVIYTRFCDDDFFGGGDCRTHRNEHNRGLTTHELSIVTERLRKSILESPEYRQIKQGNLRK